MKAKDSQTGQFKNLYVKALDSLPVGAEIDFDGDSADIPAGWEFVGNNYSTSEVKTGQTWIDGKPIYRKTIFINSLPNSTAIAYPTGINDIGILVNIIGFAYSANTFTNAFPLPYIDMYSGNNNHTELVWLGTNKEIRITTNTDRSGQSAYITLEYTKTTD